ncbi:cation:proton antiporter [Leptospira borgpetersenii]|uniref:KefB related efflux transport protein n=2 Tax=Leptospira borgpetersenii serovar Hardjo-bovis TaxID=338217 RepID=Q04P39_LEPBJ|nr:cation:proton antiporter [Leptospira borgpetersenii]ABJ77331.1 KefB related efflux transport protein [Leptospira borgpetersenii serovar Hardjo-bovis str. JB197]ABJ77750.1 KefB related efflux transport protein [Leptospira borgpetersenii serovar Hardjo-bovis str. L550]AMX56965.1 potassium transporter Kef [Leptospira borgpetersenii serovar Hardjo]AMX60196.1 potassium transporter Kef [Leptospira borgpetersenii serovar Hardjo]AMX63443.1 potassium transporter Kef [Leptospira borgpetersenii serova
MEHHSLSLLNDIALSIIFATFFAHIARITKQPLILGYVAGGLLLGPNLGLSLVVNKESIELISEIGLILLLFIIGLEIDLKELARMGKSMFILGIVQFVFCVLFGLLFFREILANFSGKFDLLYFAIALAISSTMIVVKLLHDKFEVSTIAGRLTIGVLVLQDIWAIIFMGIQPSLQDPQILKIVSSLGVGSVLVCVSFLISRFFLSRLFQAAASKPELILITSIAWCFLLCGFAEKAGLSKEMGALIAGISIAAFPYGADVIAKLSGIRDFFITLFFVALGMKIPIPSIQIISVSLIAVVFVIFSRVLTVATPVYFSGRGLRAGIVTGLNLAQISEFSLVILSLGMGYGHISKELESTVLTSMILASVVSTYIIFFNDPISRFVLKLLGMIGLKEEKRTESYTNGRSKRDIVILGYFRIAQSLLEEIEREKPEWFNRILIVDFNPVFRRFLEAKGIRWAYGDLANLETLHHLGIEDARYVICTISDMILKGTTNRRLLESIKGICHHTQPSIILTTDDVQEAKVLIESGAAHVIVPGRISGMSLFKEMKTIVDHSDKSRVKTEPAHLSLETKKKKSIGKKARSKSKVRMK